jgi:hypothetical protein
MISFRTVFGLALLTGTVALAQEPPRDVTFTYNGGEFVFLRTEFGAGRTVKGAPYSATAVTESTQTLPDGNHIKRTITSSIARDSEGRTRREQSINGIGALSSASESPKAITIHDPVGGTTATLDPSAHTAHVNHVVSASAVREYTQRLSHAETPNQAAPKMKRRQEQQANTKTEDLGTQVMEGISVQGKRVTHTIPAGQIGNERPIETVMETWYSQDLQAVVMSKTSDPRSGDSTYKLTNISRAEPDPALFQVPSDYTMTQEGGGAGGRMMRRPLPQRPQQ